MNIYCDGACHPRNPGKRIGWGVYVEGGNTFTDGLYGDSTSQRAELLAMISALFLANDGDHIWSDSKYAIGMTTKWRIKPETKNLFLVSVAKSLKAQKPNIKISWVRAHIGIPGNEIADLLAETAARNVKNKSLNLASLVASSPRDNGQRIESPASA